MTDIKNKDNRILPSGPPPPATPGCENIGRRNGVKELEDSMQKIMENEIRIILKSLFSKN